MVEKISTEVSEVAFEHSGIVTTGGLMVFLLISSDYPVLLREQQILTIVFVVIKHGKIVENNIRNTIILNEMIKITVVVNLITVILSTVLIVYEVVVSIVITNLL